VTNVEVRGKESNQLAMDAAMQLFEQNTSATIDE